MSTPQEKAKELVDKLSNYACWGRFEDEYENLQNSKQCALIAVQEMIDLLDELPMNQDVIEQFGFLLEVKQEIEKL